MSELIQSADIADKTISEWTKCWWKWFYSIEEKDHPVYPEYKIRSNDYNQGRVLDDWPEDTKMKVWFLAGVSGTTRSIIPKGDLNILVPAYNMGGSREEFPYLNENQVEKLVEDDVNGVGKDLNDAIKKKKLEATLDGEDLTNHLRPVKTDWFTVNGIPQENILGLDDIDSIKMISKGYWLCLKPLRPGDHILHLRGEAPNYKSDMTFNLTVRGGEMSSK